MKAAKLASPPEDIRTEWKRLNDLIDDVEKGAEITSSHPQLIQITRTATGGAVLDCSGLIQALIQKGVADLTQL